MTDANAPLAHPVNSQYDADAAAQWLVDIHADSIAIERGSALWEDIQRLRTALAVKP